MIGVYKYYLHEKRKRSYIKSVDYTDVQSMLLPNIATDVKDTRYVVVNDQSTNSSYTIDN